MNKNLLSWALAGAVLGSAVVGTSCKGENFANKPGSPDYYSYILKWEGKRNEVYDPNPRDNKYEPTIGVGHYLDRPDSRKTFEKVLPEVNYEDIYQGKSKLTDEQVKRLFNHDILEYESRARRAFSNFDSFPGYLREALVDGFYRGDLTGSPKTRKLINEGKFYDASVEYLNHSEYRSAKKNGMSGVFYRMNSNSKAMKRYSEEIGERK